MNLIHHSGLPTTTPLLASTGSHRVLGAASSRYHLPETDYFQDLRGAMSLRTLAGYAESERRVRLVDSNLGVRLNVPLSGPHEYSPFGAGLVERMREDPGTAADLTGKWKRALVVSPGTAILGLGAAAALGDGVLHAETAAPIMQGKAKYFLWTAGVSTTDMCLQTHLDPEQLTELKKMEPGEAAEQARIWRAIKFASHVRAMAPNYGFINVEDAQGKDLPIILGALECLKGECAVWSDDKQGTGVITAAALLSWADLTDRDLEESRVLMFGAGAGAMGVYDELTYHGVKPENILVTDRKGVLHEGRDDVNGDLFKEKMRMGIPETTTVEEFAKGADVVINLGVKETLTKDPQWRDAIIKNLADKPFVGPMTNPDPGLTPKELRRIRPDAFYGSGDQTKENPVNNFTAFGYIGAGALMAHAGGVGPAMTVAAARAIHEVAKLGPSKNIVKQLPKEQREYGSQWLVPHPLDIRLIEYEAAAVARAAAREGLAIDFTSTPTQADLKSFDEGIARLVRYRTIFVQNLRDHAEERGRQYLQMKFPDRYAPFHLPNETDPVYHVCPEINGVEFESHALEIGVPEGRRKAQYSVDGAVNRDALTEALDLLVDKLRQEGESEKTLKKTAQRELEVIVQIALIYPSLGLALALRRATVPDEDLESTPTVFHSEPVLRVVLREIPEARKAIYEFKDVPLMG